MNILPGRINDNDAKRADGRLISAKNALGYLAIAFQIAFILALLSYKPVLASVLLGACLACLGLGWYLLKKVKGAEN